MNFIMTAANMMATALNIAIASVCSGVDMTS